MIFAVAEALFLEPTLFFETAFLVAGDSALIKSKHAEAYLSQIESVESVTKNQSYRFCSITLAPVALLADTNAERGISVIQANFVEANSADRFAFNGNYQPYPPPFNFCLAVNPHIF